MSTAIQFFRDSVALMEAAMKCCKCKTVSWERLSRIIECPQCTIQVVPAMELLNPTKDRVRSEYNCTGCKHSWTANSDVERRCIEPCCSGIRRLCTKSEAGFSPIVTECCDRVCWEMCGAVGDDVFCRECSAYSPAKRAIGNSQKMTLCRWRFYQGRERFDAHLADLGPLIFAAPEPRRVRRFSPPKHSAPLFQTSNRFDLLTEVAD